MHPTPTFIGLDTQYPTADHQRLTRVHLDGAASPLPAQAGLTAIQTLLPHYSNTHSYVHSSAQISTRALAWAHATVLNFVGAKAQDYTAIFAGSGTTACINRVARGLAAARPGKNTVLISAMEHHANDLPHRQFGNKVVYLPLSGNGASMGAVDLAQFEALCEEHRATANYVAVSSVSNVTGIRNPIKQMCKIAHDYDILVLVDGAQSVAHLPTGLSDRDIDFFVFSGHKVYAPMAPGVLIAKKALLEKLPGQDLGGGSVETVSYFDFEMLARFPDKEESGTPNIIGAVALAATLEQLNEYGMQRIAKHDSRLITRLMNGLQQIDQLTIYADRGAERTGAVAFNITGIDHGLLAAILNDYFAIAVRNECFCAHPYVSSLIKEELWELDLSDIPDDQQEAYINLKRGMVRASISLYNTEDDVDRLLNALRRITRYIDDYAACYSANRDGSYTHNQFQLDWQQELGNL